ncbi:MAG: DUF3604 domain-containing protein [Candidatus Binatia bacterium]
MASLARHRTSPGGHPRRRRIANLCLAGALALLASACGSDDCAPTPAPTPTPVAAYPAPWQRTEERAPCDNVAPLRQPFFGDLHVHTRVSADATIYGTKVGPREAYAFALGDPLAMSDDMEQPTREVLIERPLDFAAITDHSEWFGEVDVCTDPTSSIYDSQRLCRVLRLAEDLPEQQFAATIQWLYPAGVPDPPPGLPFCNTPGVDCDAAAVSVWQEMQAAAEEVYDRSAACGFTSFIGYEHTASTLGQHLHRNVIFRNHHVPRTPASQLETERGGVPQGLWTAIETDCLGAGDGCDAVLIPHNSNLSGGGQFFTPADGAEARRRQDREPLAEIHQQKGNSECRFDRLAGRGVLTEDELCAFEQLPRADEAPFNPPPPIDEYPARNMIRNALKDGLALEQTLGVNPFQFGFVGSTDTHNAAPGNTEDRYWEGGEGSQDSSDARRIANHMDNNPGGLTVVWAEENSRDALFAALRRRETYATSGARPVLRFFAGTLDGVACGAPDFLERAYATGTPMGGELGEERLGPSPRFAVLALKDPGTTDNPGTDLQRVQIIKGWIDADGATHERVHDVAGDAGNGADVDPATCAPRGAGAAELCAVWEDPEFDPTQRAFYYARVLDNPTCRWSTWTCKAAGVDPFAPDCTAQVEQAGSEFADCCLTREDDPSLQPIVQERAWSSPVWYRPDAIGSLGGTIHFGPGPGADRLDLSIALAAAPLGRGDAPLTIELVDDDLIYRETVPASALTQDGQGGATLRIQRDRLDLSKANRVDHFVSVQISSGLYRSTHTRLWRATADALAPEPTPQ